LSEIKIESDLGWIPTKVRQQIVASANTTGYIIHVHLESRLNGTSTGPNTRLANRLWQASITVKHVCLQSGVRSINIVDKEKTIDIFMSRYYG
jgi:hypothetical protein